MKNKKDQIVYLNNSQIYKIKLDKLKYLYKLLKASDIKGTMKNSYYQITKTIINKRLIIKDNFTLKLI